MSKFDCLSDNRIKIQGPLRLKEFRSFVECLPEQLPIRIKHPDYWEEGGCESEIRHDYEMPGLSKMYLKARGEDIVNVGNMLGNALNNLDCKIIVMWQGRCTSNYSFEIVNSPEQYVLLTIERI